MKDVLRLLTLGLFTMCAQVSAQKMPIDYLNNAADEISAGHFDAAQSIYRQVLHDYPFDEAYPIAAYSIGDTYYKFQKYDSAVSAFQAILRDSIILNNGINRETSCYEYRECLHNTCETLSDTYLKLYELDSALLYLSYADTLYRYEHFCGNAYAANDVRLALKYSSIFRCKGDNDRAVKCLLPTLSLDALTSTRDVLSALKILLAIRKDLLPSLDSAIDNLEYKTIINSYSNQKVHYIRFLQTEIVVDNLRSPKRWKGNNETWTEYLRSTHFYKMIHDL